MEANELHLFVFVSLVAEGSWQLRDVVWSLHFSENAGNPDAKEFLCYEVFAAMGNHVLWHSLVTGEKAPNKKLSEQNLKLFIAQDLVFWWHIFISLYKR